VKYFLSCFGKGVKGFFVGDPADTGSGSVSSPSPAVTFAWVPLITSDAFTGINTDVLTTATGIISIMVIVVGIGILVAVLTR